MVSKSNRLPYIAIAITTALLLILTLAGLSIVSAAPTTVDVSKSVKQVDKAEALPGTSLLYTIIITNAGTSTGNFIFTDTLPAGLSFVAGSVVTQTSNAVVGSWNVSANTFTATGTLLPSTGNPIVTLKFGAAIASGTMSGTVLTNVAQISDASGTFPITATTKVVSQTDTFIYLPIILKSAPAPVVTIGAVTADTGSNYNHKWTVSWNSVGPSNSYIVEEATDENFSSIISTVTVNGLSHQFSHAASLSNIYYYRVRYVSGAGSAWSNVTSAVGAYRDDFTTSDGNWLKVRQDLDDTQNVLSYVRPENWLKLHVQGRWDYLIASPLKPTPAGDYQIETNVKFAGPGNLNTYGLIVGADWNGDTCPTLIPDPSVSSRAVDDGNAILDPNEQEENMSSSETDPPATRATTVITDNCFNHYYRIKLLWFGKSNRYKLQVKRIDYHESPKNEGRGESLVSTVEIPIDDQDEWNSWRLEVRRSTGEFKLFGNNTLRATWSDTQYINDVYWGLFADTDEYPGSDPWYEYINVRPLD